MDMTGYFLNVDSRKYPVLAEKCHEASWLPGGSPVMAPRNAIGICLLALNVPEGLLKVGRHFSAGN
jgi:hypothetical protein